MTGPRGEKIVVFPRDIGDHRSRVYSLSTYSGNTYDSYTSLGANTYDSAQSNVLRKEAPAIAREYRRQKILNHHLKQKQKNAPKWKIFARDRGEYEPPSILERRTGSDYKRCREVCNSYLNLFVKNIVFKNRPINICVACSC